MVKFDYDGCGSFVSDEEQQRYVQTALKAYDLLMAGDGAGSDFLGWKTLPSDVPESLIEECEAVRDDWKAKGVDLVLVIGIGGSYLGSKCAIEALSHSFIRPEGVPQIVFAGQNLSEEYLSEVLDLAKIRNVACVVISKSGTTTEPAVAFRIIKNYIEETYGEKEASERIVAVTDARRGALKTLAERKGYRSFVVPDNVGGRFSVLTPVGLLPIVLAGFDVRQMLEGAAEMQKYLSLDRSEFNPAVLYASIRNLLYAEKGFSTEILVCYTPKLQYLGEWWKQLFGESEGKEGKGIFPASVVCTTDLHSMGQFIQDGSRNLFETVVSVEKSNRDLTVFPDGQNYDELNYLAGQHVEHCNAMAQLGTSMAHIEGGVPQMVLSIERINERNLGSLFYFFEFSCGISAYMLGVNPFNQPGVETYKHKMFALLKKPGYESI
ncbi:MAG: glucose-6-phosphate isomerase [Bacteroidales bacterium]|nr:glucose-6-phosphate isomerase [Bacteroidales bacterium]